jgi:hypothetical protein
MPEELKHDNYMYGNGQQPQKNSFAKPILLPSFLCGIAKVKRRAGSFLTGSRLPLYL